MAGAVGNYSDGETIHGGDLNADLTSLLGNDAQIVVDIFAGWNILVSGFALTAGAGMTVNIAAGLAYASGIRLNMTSGSVTLGTGNTSPRYDVIWVQAGKTAAINGTTSNPTQYDSGAYGVQAGTPGASPAVPALGDPTKVQIGTVYVPANATTASGCTLHSQATAPNAQGPVRTFIDLLAHIAAAITASNAVHGIQQGSGHGFDADSVDGVHAAGFDAAGSAGAVQTNLATETSSRTSGDTSIRNDLTSGALIPAKAQALVSAATILSMDHGIFSFNNTGSGTQVVTYATNFSGRVPSPTWTFQGAGGPSSYSVTNVTSTGFTATWSGGSGGACTGFWLAIG
jgi:hypothetical protein